MLETKNYQLKYLKLRPMFISNALFLSKVTIRKNQQVISYKILYKVPSGEQNGSGTNESTKYFSMRRGEKYVLPPFSIKFQQSCGACLLPWEEIIVGFLPFLHRNRISGTALQRSLVFDAEQILARRRHIWRAPIQQPLPTESERGIKWVMRF